MVPSHTHARFTSLSFSLSLCPFLRSDNLQSNDILYVHKRSQTDDKSYTLATRMLVKNLPKEGKKEKNSPSPMYALDIDHFHFSY